METTDLPITGVAHEPGGCPDPGRGPGSVGCATVNIGKDFDLKGIEERVTVGKTQRTEVQRWLGEPVGTGRLPRMENTRLKYLEIRFQTDGTVDSYKWSGETE